MTIFKTFLKILNKNKFIVILYTIILITFGGLNMQTKDNNISFQAVKPDVVIINEDEYEGITKNLINYIKENSNIVNIENNEDKINDALFYRETNYVIYIPKDYNKDFRNNKNPEIKIKSSGDYQASYAEMILERYIEVANTYNKKITNDEELINKIDETLKKQTQVEITSQLDTDTLYSAAFYFNFESYSILACLIYVICLVLSTFNNEKIRKKNIISSTNYKKINRTLLLSNSLYSLTLWLFYLIMSFILIGNIMFTSHGIIYMINSLIFTICATTLAFLIGTIVTKKEAISGIVNVVALGSSFLCGAFVPVEYLPKTVLNIAHALPTYWYIQNNEITRTLEKINIETLKPVFTNWIVILLFTVVFIIITNIISKRKQKLDR
jgi:ABC-2 type transport system permease protein